MDAEGFVVVSGLPASGKSYLAVPLARELGLPLISKDDIKETLGEHLPCEGREGLARLGPASVEVLWTLASRAPRAVLESFWYPEFTIPRLVALGRPVVEVFCDAPRPLCAERFLERKVAGRHSVHQEHAIPDDELREELAAWPEGAPLGVGALIRVDTTAPVDVRVVAEQVTRAMRTQSRLSSGGRPCAT